MKYIFFFLLGTSVLNFLIAVMVRVKTQHKEFNDLLIYWPCIILTFVAAAALGANERQIAYAYFFQIFSSNLIVKMMCAAQGIKFNWRFYIGLQLGAMLLCVYLLETNLAGFTPAVLLVSATFSLPFIKPIWHSLVANRKSSSWIEKAMGITFLTGILNHFNYALFRLDTSTAFWGWSLSMAQYQCLALFLPLLINWRREENERGKLLKAIEHLSGRQKQSSPIEIMQTEELYRNLEFQIAQKERYSSLLRESNNHLEEEREINEVLIRTISHDLANPLTIINAYSEMLSNKKVAPEEQEKVWGRLRSNIESALNMISRIRTAILTRSQSSLITTQAVDLEQVLSKLNDLFEARLIEKNIKLNLTNQVSNTTMVMAEENTLVEHVLANIISNALKFSYPDSSIDITLTESTHDIKIAVRDYGTGIPEGKAGGVFSSRPGTQGETGSGFGLMLLGYFVKKFNAQFELITPQDKRGTLALLTLKKYIPINAPLRSEQLPTFMVN